MKGPINSDRNKIGSLIIRLEVALVFAGGMVVSGLLWESWPEIVTSAKRHRLPDRQTTGGILVTLGVAAEVVLAASIARLSRRSEEIADRDIAQLNAETERLRKENNETAILLAYRSLGDRASFVESIRRFSGTVFIIECAPDDPEVSLFRLQLYQALREAAWIPRPWDSGSRRFNFGLAVLTVVTPDHSEECEAAKVLATQLHNRQISVFAGTTTHMVSPGVVILQIGSRPETIEMRQALRSEFERRTPGPVTPPQA